MAYFSYHEKDINHDLNSILKHWIVNEHPCLCEPKGIWTWYYYRKQQGAPKTKDPRCCNS